MSWKRTLVIGGAVVALVATAAWSGAVRDRAGQQAGVDRRATSHFAWCDGALERLEIMNVAGPVYLGLDSEQKEAWTALMTDLRTALAGFEQPCSAAMTGKDDGPAPVRLAALRDQLAIGIDAIDRVRPTFDAFYRSLDTAQRERIETMLTRRHR